MNVTIEVNPRLVIDKQFDFGNVESKYGCNNLWFTYDGKPKIIISGEFHYARADRRDWRQELLKMKESGLTAVSTYVFWNFHEKSAGVFDFTGDLDIRAFTEICRSVGMPVILRIGPWCHGEVVYGGFPEYINALPYKRTDNPKYLTYVSRLFTKIYEQIGEYCDGETIIGIQLENEFYGDIKHLKTLRTIAEKVGFKTPFFTMTLWPTNRPDDKFLPMCGGYPEAPWTQNKKPLPPGNRFAISPIRADGEIGNDVNNNAASDSASADDYPFATCELGAGIQVTQHRRPIISDKDGYGIGFTRLASGVNWLGYYMYHGGRNPVGRLLQESRLTGYPNNYPIIDYDFQAAISRYGYVRKHGDRLRLLHTFINTFDENLALKQSYFGKLIGQDACVSPSISVRADENLSGYFFACAYERGAVCRGIDNLKVTLKNGERVFDLPTIDLKSGAMIFYPFNVTIGGKKFDYITAQPITIIRRGGKLSAYFAECEGVTPTLCEGGTVKELPLDSAGYAYKNGRESVEIIVLSDKRALEFHIADNRVVFTDATVYSDNGEIIAQAAGGKKLNIDGRDIKLPTAKTPKGFGLRECGKVKGLRYNHYLYSRGKRKYYELKIDKESLGDFYDVILEFDFTGLNLQVFADKLLINDYFNIDGKFVMSMRQHARYLNDTDTLIIRAVPQDKFGVGKVYNEIDMPYKTVDLKLTKVTPIIASAHNAEF